MNGKVIAVMNERTGTAVIIGGTGMLQETTLWLIERSDMTVLVSRRASQFGKTVSNVTAIDADWNDQSFSAKVRPAIEYQGQVANALLWIHDPEPVLAWLLPLLPGARIVLVLGSTDGRPELVESDPNVVTVRLGSMPAAGGRRWLTHGEISAGAVEAFRTGKSIVVGELRGVL